jgi:hypothetical protein
MKKDTPPAEVTATLETAKVPPRVFILNALQLFGIAAAALAVPSPETAAVIAILPASIAANVGTIALVALAAKPGVNLLSDWIDNGKLDGSFIAKAIAFMLIPAFMFATMGCGVRINPVSADGCYTITQTRNGQTYAFGPCADEAGQIIAYRSDWKNAEGVELRATYIIATKVTKIQYKTPEGLWVGWSAKAGISLDGMPPAGQPTAAD